MTIRFGPRALNWASKLKLYSLNTNPIRPLIEKQNKTLKKGATKERGKIDAGQYIKKKICHSQFFILFLC